MNSLSSSGRNTGAQCVRVQAATGQQGGQGIAGEEAQVAAVEQALVAVLEAALEQCGDQPGIGHVGHRDQQHPARRQQCLQLLQHRLGVHHVLDHVGRHDHLVARAAKRVFQVELREVAEHQPAAVRPGLLRHRGIQFHRVHGAAERVAQLAREIAAGGAEFQHRAARRHPRRQALQGVVRADAAGRALVAVRWRCRCRVVHVHHSKKGFWRAPRPHSCGSGARARQRIRDHDIIAR